MGGETGFDVFQGEFLEALCNDWCECYGVELRLAVGVYLGIGMIMADFKQGGMTACSRDRLKMVVNTCDSCSAHALSTFPGTPSGPAAFLGFTAQSIRIVSCTSRVSGGELEAGGDWSGGWSDVVECCV